jgi:predicted enzyme related to lactoylglutathione lyase
MIKNLAYLSLIVLVACTNNVDNSDNEPIIENIIMETPIAKVTGIGGIFFKSQNPEKMKEWFNQNLGLITNEYGSLFEFTEGENKSKGYLQWSPFSNKTTYFNPSEKEFMINYRVDDLEKLAHQLKQNDVTILDTIESYEYGKFLHILDIENNKIELWEPIDNSFTAIYDGTTNVKTGVGGVFFKAQNPKKLNAWYKENLSFNINDYGCLFEFYNAVNTDQKEVLQWGIFSDSTDYFAPSEKSFMVNYKVENLEELVVKLKANGVVFTDTIDTYDYGKFIHAITPENHKIELWEPNYDFKAP